MIERRPFSYDAFTGITTTFCYDHDTDVVTMEKSQDVEPLIEMNKHELLDIADHWRGELHKVASVPLHIYMQLKADGTVDDPKRLRAWLNDRDNRMFRTRAGVV